MMTAEQIQLTKSLDSLLSGLAQDIPTLEVSGVAIDSRQVNPGNLFLAYQGSETNGIEFIDDAIKAGAIAIAIDSNESGLTVATDIPIMSITDLRKQAGIIASRFYNEPSKLMNVIGVTGTNGKTTVSYLLAHALSHCDKSTGFIGTLGYGDVRHLQTGSMTTPDPVTLHALLSEMQQGFSDIVMEVSSHALDQSRVSGMDFNVAVFTNLTRDHLDYHASMEDYAAAKAMLFHRPELEHAVINLDDDFGKELVESITDKVDVVGFTKHEDTYQHYKTQQIKTVYGVVSQTRQLHSTVDIQSPWGNVTIKSPLLGEFNGQNILAVFASLCLSEVMSEQAATAISEFPGVPGRMERFITDGKPMLVVDYAHTPDALEKVLSVLRPNVSGELYCVFGCGGDRDVGKRPEMGRVAEQYCDHIVITNDNPRSEDPEQIAKQIMEGMVDQAKAMIKLDRSDAITNTFLQAKVGDVVVIAGKGHETTQQIGKQFFPFCDRELARRLTERAS